jgi:LuxR family maltose regulon positive regulatory protein
LVLDDYHLIDSREIHEALTFLIEHLPPHFHLVIATRADPQRRWYRNHHLFADVLLQRLREAGVDRPSELHRRASAWFEGQDLVQEAIEHALAAADWQRATRLLIQFSPSFTFRGQFHTVLSWLNALPDDVVRGNPTLSVYYAGAFMYTYQFEAAEIRLQEAE